LTYVAVALQGRAAIGPVEPYLGVELAPFHEGTRGIELPTIWSPTSRSRRSNLAKAWSGACRWWCAECPS
jgi:hypothetical protein